MDGRGSGRGRGEEWACANSRGAKRARECFSSSLMLGRNGNDRSSAKQPDSGEDTTRSRRSHGSLQADASHELAARVAHGGGVRGRCGELLAVVRWLCCWHVSLYKKRGRESDEREVRERRNHYHQRRCF